MKKLFCLLLFIFIGIAPLTANYAQAIGSDSTWQESFNQTLENEGLDAAVAAALEDGQSLDEVMTAAITAGQTPEAVATAALNAGQTLAAVMGASTAAGISLDSVVAAAISLAAADPTGTSYPTTQIVAAAQTAGFGDSAIVSSLFNGGVAASVISDVAQATNMNMALVTAALTTLQNQQNNNNNNNGGPLGFGENQPTQNPRLPQVPNQGAGGDSFNNRPVSPETF
ncbi:MAG: hypothetical protein KJ950_01670 [Proteobacteria bacterium]|nr:hypothetical protein [Pseudomonadota bacterium]MBU1688207.1 hypothetical protein [Pseudomonadota bacterium]